MIFTIEFDLSNILCQKHCIENSRYVVFSVLYFSGIGLNTEIDGYWFKNIGIQSKYEMKQNYVKNGMLTEGSTEKSRVCLLLYSWLNFSTVNVFSNLLTNYQSQ